MEDIYIRNMSAGEAELFLEQSIDSAFFRGHKIVRVVHGRGTVLKKLTAEIAGRYPYSRLREEYFGDTNPGVSYVEFD